MGLLTPAATGTGPLVKIIGIMEKHQYKEILAKNLEQSAQELHLGRRWTFMHDNDPKHTALIVKKWLKDNKSNVLEWSSSDLNPMENLWAILKSRVAARNPSCLQELELIAMEEWKNISPETCLTQIKNYPTRLTNVIQQKDYTIDH